MVTSLKNNMSRIRENPWKIVYCLLCLALLALAAYQFYNLFVIFPPYAQDYKVFVGAVQALDHTQNPYLLSNINLYRGAGTLEFVYPPQTLYFFWFLQFLFIFQNVWIYYTFLGILLIFGSILLLTLDQKPHYLFLLTLMITGFISLWWNFTTGNKDILFLFLFAIIFTLLLTEKYWQSSIVMGLTVGFSLFATPFVALFLVIRRPIVNRLCYIALSAGIVMILFLVSYCINASFFYSYIGTLLESNSTLIQLGGWNAPIPYWLFYDLFRSISSDAILPTILVSCAYVGIILYATVNYYKKHPDDPLKIYALVLLAVFMLLPRMMPYNFIILVIPLYILFKDVSYQLKILVLTAISLLPLIVWYLPLFSVNKDELPVFLGPYVQTYSLIIVFFIVILHDNLSHSVKSDR